METLFSTCKFKDKLCQQGETVGEEQSLDDHDVIFRACSAQ